MMLPAPNPQAMAGGGSHHITAPPVKVTPNPDHVAKTQREQEDRDWSFWLQVLTEARLTHQGRPSTDAEIVATARAFEAYLRAEPST